MKGLKQRRTLLAGLVLILIGNIAVLAMAAYNRQGEPDSRVQLTERELWLPPARGFDKENSAITLMLRYRVKGEQRDAANFKDMDMQESWLNRDKLTALGFDFGSLSSADDKRARYTAWITRREVILVLEYDGVAYREAEAWIKQQLAEAEEEAASLPESHSPSLRERLQVRLNMLRTSETRLYVIDAGLDRATLRQRYADDSRYLLMKGTVGLSLNRENDDSKRALHGVIYNVLLDRVHVPSSYHAQLQAFFAEGRSGRLDGGAPRYAVEFNLGQRLEPWVSSVTALPGGGD